MSSSSSHASSPESHCFEALLGSLRPFLRGELEKVNMNLPSLISLLRSVGAGECWHKHGTFLDHLVDTYRILNIWKAQESFSETSLKNALENGHFNDDETWRKNCSPFFQPMA
ncbi:unnamed protein product [Citrullus colocynthis]|uniref:DUF6817 domain-containing protein n=1 Tax=Citrullus colocynthis TaxID=252529 RepID=A0ABP0XVH4_9ROSI